MGRRRGEIGELAGKHLKKVQLELGGKNAVIVCDDADLDSAASAIAFGAWFHQGQICMTTGRILANALAEPLTEKLVAKAKHLPAGDPLGQVALGPVISDRGHRPEHLLVEGAQRATISPISSPHGSPALAGLAATPERLT